MESIRELYRIGVGPSSSHTMAPKRAAELFLQRHPDGAAYRITLYGSLAATGKGHLTDKAIHATFEGREHEILWKPENRLPLYSNGMLFEVLSDKGRSLDSWKVYSTGGGAILEEGQTPEDKKKTYNSHRMREILEVCQKSGLSFWEYVENAEGKEIWDYLREIWHAMKASIERGLHAEGVIEGGLGIRRQAWAYHQKAFNSAAHLKRQGLIAAYALAVSEENATGGTIVTAPTCGSCGVLPASLYYALHNFNSSEMSILRALATAGLIGNLVKHNASISGAEVGCQGEVGTACSMAAAAATQLLGGTIRQIEYAAEMGLEHNLGLTCDPVEGLVQIPCIERNVFAATQALNSADYAMLSDGSHRISFDDVVSVMKQTGQDLPSLYRETASGGLAKAYRRRKNKEAEAQVRKLTP
ncbi:MAG: L-serine ammonia-lyase [Ignavibacteria bacterium]|nr:L-serine ammonia-lyase [Ignavibacteria bacterium]